MLNNMRLPLVLAAVGIFVPLAQGGTIVFNTDTGIVDSYSGGVLRTGEGTWTSSLDAENQIYTWAFTGTVTIPSGTTLQFVGSNLASFRAGDIIFGTEGGEAITIDASSYTDNLGNLVRGAGGGLGGDGGHGAEGNFSENGGAGGNHGKSGCSGISGNRPSSGVKGSQGYSGDLGGIGAGALASDEATAGKGGWAGAGASVTYDFPIVYGGEAPGLFENGEPGVGGYKGLNGGDAGDGTMGSGGAFNPAGIGAAALAAGNGGQGGGGGGSGGQGSGGGGGSGGSGGSTSIIGTFGCRGGDGGDGGAGGEGGQGGRGGKGSAGGGAVEFVALGRMTANVAVLTSANGQDALSKAEAGAEGKDGVVGNPGEAGGTYPLAHSGGDGGHGGKGGAGGGGGDGANGGGGAAGMVRLAGTVIGGSGLITGNMAGGAGTSSSHSFEDGDNGQLIIAQDCNSSVNTSMQAGALVTGLGSEVGLHRRSPQLNADAPRLLGLAEGYDTTGLLAASAADLDLEGTSSCPVIACRDVTHLGDDYIGYNMVMLAGGTRKIDKVTFSADPDSTGNLYTGPTGDRERVMEFQGGDVYGFLIPEDGVEMKLKYNIARTIMKCTVDLKDEETIDLKADRFVYDSMQVKGKFDLYNAPAITKELTIEDIAEGTTLKVDILDAEGGCDFLDVTGEAVLDGTLELQFKDFTPIIGMEYRFLKAGSFSGQFDELNVQGIDPSMVDYDLAGGTFTIVPEPATLTLLVAMTLPLLRRKRRA